MFGHINATNFRGVSENFIFLAYDQVKWRLRPVTSFQDTGTSFKLEVIQQTWNIIFHHISKYQEDKKRAENVTYSGVSFKNFEVLGNVAKLIQVFSIKTTTQEKLEK